MADAICNSYITGMKDLCAPKLEGALRPRAECNMLLIYIPRK